MSSPAALHAAHSHNDGERDVPLFGALELGIASVEADVWLVDDELLVAHDPEGLAPELTLRSLYLDPLREQVGERGGVFTGDEGPRPGWTTCAPRRGRAPSRVPRRR
jgi:hypothetical protein